LAASPQRDQHPRHGLPRIAGDAPLDQIWLRVEEQALARLDDDPILFGIRLRHCTLAQLSTRSIAQRLAHALRSMSPAMAAYKRLEDCRERIILQLETYREPHNRNP